MYHAIYAEINLLCILILLYILSRMKVSQDRQAGRLAFIRVVWSVVAILALDTVWALLDGHPGARQLNGLVNAAYMADTGIVTYAWLKYADRRMDRARTLSPAAQLPGLIPLLLLLILAFASLRTGWLFFIDKNGVYHRGPLYLLQPALSYSYLLYSLARLLRALRTAGTPQRRAELGTLLSFYVLPAAGGAAEIVFFGLPFLWPMAALSLLMVYLNYQLQQISTDALTGINNRRQFDVRLTALLSEPRRDRTLCLLLMDIDAFKSINDTCGHVEGDSALLETATVLKKLCGMRSLFLARYGGDEFAILTFCGGPAQAAALKDEIARAFAARNAATDKPYRITLSVGTALLPPESQEGAEAFISAADAALYEEKKAFYSARR